MIIRTVTVFDQINVNNFEHKIRCAADFLKRKKNKIESLGHQLQTTRISCQLFDEKVNNFSDSDLLTLFKKINHVCQAHKINFFNPGTIPLNNQDLLKKLPDILKSCENIHCSVAFLAEESLSKQAASAAQLFTRIVELDYKSTFRIGVQANCPELIPFYPASYYKGIEPKYALGIQIPTTINQIANFDLTFDEFFDDLFDKINIKLIEFENKISKENDNYEYKGIDTSFAPMVDLDDSIGRVYENLLNDKIGNYKTLTTTAKFTEIAKKFDVKKTGFCGMMLPPLEDSILAKRFSEGELTIQKLLYYSSVCACGLDTIPVSSEVSETNIANIYLDMATLAYNHNKPLCVRLMSIPNSKRGDMTTFDSPYICNTKLII